MTETLDVRDGGCLCGGVRYRAQLTTDAVLQCHCENCRRLTGNYVAAVRSSRAQMELIDPGGSLGWHDLGFAAYGFCRSCGSTLFFEPKEPPSHTSVMVGTLDDATGLRLESVWFADDAQPHNTLPEGIPLHRGNG